MGEFKGMRALIIEDDPVSVEVLGRLLANLQVEVEALYDGYDLGDRLEKAKRPNVVFLDLEMPIANGYLVLDLLRANPTFKGVPVVAYTTHTSHLNSARQAGFDGLLGKPLDSRRFPDQFRAILNGEPVWEVP